MLFSGKISFGIVFPISILGFSSIITQLVVLREFQSVLDGNELVYGLFFAVWMTITAAGAKLGKYFESNKSNRFVFIFIQLSFAILPAFMVFFLRYLRFQLFDFGVSLNIIEILIYVIIILAPFCMVSGLLFTKYCVILSKQSNEIPKAYFYETIGSITGGLIFSILLIYLFNVFQSLSFLFIVNIISIIFFTLFLRYYGIVELNKIGIRKYIFIFLILSLIPTAFPFLTNIDKETKKYLFKGQRILETKDTPYGNIVVTETGRQINFFSDGMLLFSTGNPVVAEESVHYALSQIKSHNHILLISGGICGLTNEILKYNPSTIDYTEIDPELIHLGNKFTQFSSDKRVKIINEDSRQFIKKTKTIYNAAIIFLPEPSTAQLNRYYTYEFFVELKSKLNKQGIITTALPLTENYISKEASDLNSSLYNTLKLVFKNVIIIPGGKNFYICSDKQLSYKIGELIDSAAIDNIYVNKYYYDELSTKQRAENILKSISSKQKVNYDFHPIVYFQQIQYWLSYFKINHNILLGILIIPFIFVLIKMKPLGIGLFVSGFTSIAAELIIIFAFQFIFGNVYYMISLIIISFMLGLASGVRIFKRTNNLKKFIISQFFLCIYITLLPHALFLIRGISEYYVISVIIIILLTIIGAAFVGIQFSFATGNSNKQLLIRKKKNISTSVIASEAYSADLFGSAFGSLLITTVFLPTFGLINLGFFIGVANLFSVLLVIVTTRNK
ncbi:MAG: hypothetical protein EPN82_10905 [Bacteroidetes bacterium]|nr:MAG: hypothetical protein EPN82_10905 [Bacteroidota bacterium]